MPLRFTIRRLLAVLVIAGLAWAPLARPVMAGMPSDVSMPAMADESSPSAMTGEMADEMPCCPSKAPMPVDCDKCVFMASCASIGFTAIPTSVVHPVPMASGGVAPRRNESRPEGLRHPPPEHPPRILV